MRCRTPSLDRAHLKASLKFVIPSAIYAVNNNIYLGELEFLMELIVLLLISAHSRTDSGAASHLGDPLLCPHRRHHRPLQVHPKEGRHCPPVHRGRPHCRQHYRGQVR